MSIEVLKAKMDEAKIAFDLLFITTFVVAVISAVLSITNQKFGFLDQTSNVIQVTFTTAGTSLCYSIVFY